LPNVGKQLVRRSPPPKPILKRAKDTVCPISLGNIFLVSNLGASPDYSAACVNAGGSLLNLQASQLVNVGLVLVGCGALEAVIGTYNSFNMGPCPTFGIGQLSNFILNAADCGAVDSVLCYSGVQPVVSIAFAVLSEVLTVLNVLTSIIPTTISISTTTIDIFTSTIITATLQITDATSIVTVASGTSQVTLQTTATVTSTSTSNALLFATSPIISIISTVVTTSSPITTATVFNYLGTTTRSQTISVASCSKF
jgi:hypothetical protein